MAGVNIPFLTPLDEQPAADDLFEVFDVSAQKNKRVTKANLLDGIGGGGFDNEFTANVEGNGYYIWNLAGIFDLNNDNTGIDFINSALGSNGVRSVEWINRYLKNSGGITTLDWENRVLRDSNTQPTLDWQNKALIDNDTTMFLWGDTVSGSPELKQMLVIDTDGAYPDFFAMLDSQRVVFNDFFDSKFSELSADQLGIYDNGGSGFGAAFTAQQFFMHDVVNSQFSELTAEKLYIMGGFGSANMYADALSIQRDDYTPAIVLYQLGQDLQIGANSAFPSGDSWGLFLTDGGSSYIDLFNCEIGKNGVAGLQWSFDNGYGESVNIHTSVNAWSGGSAVSEAIIYIAGNPYKIALYTP